MRMELIIASPGGLFGAYPQRSVQEYRRFYAFGSGAEYAMGAMQVAWDQTDSAEDLARIGVETAAKFDVGSGLPLSLRTIPLREAQNGSLFPPAMKREEQLSQANGTGNGVHHSAANGSTSPTPGANGSPLNGH